MNAKLSNGITLQNVAVPWTTGFITVLLLLAAAVLGVVGATQSGTSSSSGAGKNLNTAVTSGDPHSTVDAATSTTGAVSGHTGPPAGHTDPLTLFLHFQFISSTGLLSINYPVLYQSFTANFAWANFIIPIKSLLEAAIRLRKCDIDPDDLKIPTVSPGVSKGISTYLAQKGINDQDIFGLIYLVILCACAILLGLFLIVKGALIIVASKVKAEKRPVWEARSQQVTHMASNNSLRLVRNHRLRYC